MNLTLRQRADRPDSKGLCRIFLDVTWDNQRLPLPTGVKCLPAHFAPTKRLPISTKDLQSVQKNTDVGRIVTAVTDVFTKAAAAEHPVTKEHLLAAVTAVGPAKRRKPAATAATPTPTAGGSTFEDFFQLWRAEHPHQGQDAGRRFRQVVDRIERYHPGLRLAQLTKAIFFDYITHLTDEGLADSTVSGHVKFFRICFRLAELHIPAWLRVKVKIGRAVALRRDELQALYEVEPPHPYLRREQERLLFQTLLLLRDSDLRRLKPHHITEQEMTGAGRQLVLSFYQKKTGDEVRLPLPPAAVAIWEGWKGQVPVVTQQKRNMYIKELAQLAGLTREFVRVRFRGGQPHEEVLPLWQVITTHTPRHTGADLVLWGSEGDQNLKEVALGHLAGSSVYGYDTIERYGPLFLRAWQKVWAVSNIAHSSGNTTRQSMVSAVQQIGGIRPVACRIVPL